MKLAQLKAGRTDDQQYLRVRKTNWNERAYLRLEFKAGYQLPWSTLFDPFSFQAMGQTEQVSEGQAMMVQEDGLDDWELFTGILCDGDKDNKMNLC